MALVANAAKGVSATYLAVLVALSLYFATIQGMGVSTLAWAILFFYSISWALTVFYDVDKGSIHMVYEAPRLKPWYLLIPLHIKAVKLTLGATLLARKQFIHG